MPAEHSSPSPTWVARWCFFSLVFFGLPMVLAWLGTLEIFNRQEKERRQIFQEHLRDLLASFEKRIDPTQHLVRVLRQAEQDVFRPRKNRQNTSATNDRQTEATLSFPPGIHHPRFRRTSYTGIVRLSRASNAASTAFPRLSGNANR